MAALPSVSANFHEKVSVLRLWSKYQQPHDYVCCRQIKFAIRSALSKAGPRLNHGDSSESLELEDSVTEEASSPFSELDMDFNAKSAETLFDETLVEEAGMQSDVVNDGNTNVAAKSRDDTPELSEPSQDVDADTRKDAKRFTRFPLHENIPWKTVFDFDAYRKAVEPVSLVHN